MFVWLLALGLALNAQVKEAPDGGGNLGPSLSKRDVAGAFDEDEVGTGDSLMKGSQLGWRCDPVLGAAEDEGRNADCTEPGPSVERQQDRQDATHLGRGDAGSDEQSRP